MIYISYFTKNTKYEKIMETYLHPSLHRWNLPHDIEGVDDLGNWDLNTQYKPKFILKMLEKHGKNLIFIDADATINLYPELFYNIPNEYDFGCHYLSWEDHYGRPTDNGKYELLSGTLYLKNNTKIKELLYKWIKSLVNHDWEQKNLARVLTHIPQLKIFKLPREYAYISSTPSGNPSKIIENPVISHYQLSRKNGK